MSGRQRQYAKKNKEQHPKRKYPKASRGGVVSDSPVWEYDAYRDRRLTGTSRPKAFQQALERCGKTGSSLKQTLTEKSRQRFHIPTYLFALRRLLPKQQFCTCQLSRCSCHASNAKEGAAQTANKMDQNGFEYISSVESYGSKWIHLRTWHQLDAHKSTRPTYAPRSVWKQWLAT